MKNLDQKELGNKFNLLVNSFKTYKIGDFNKIDGLNIEVGNKENSFSYDEKSNTIHISYNEYNSPNFDSNLAIEMVLLGRNKSNILEGVHKGYAEQVASTIIARGENEKYFSESRLANLLETILPSDKIKDSFSKGKHEELISLIGDTTNIDPTEVVLLLNNFNNNPEELLSETQEKLVVGYINKQIMENDKIAERDSNIEIAIGALFTNPEYLSTDLANKTAECKNSADNVRKKLSELTNVSNVQQENGKSI